MIQRYLKAARMLELTSLRVGFWECSVCDTRLHIRICANEMGVRCVRCGASPVTQSIVAVIRRHVPYLATQSVYELSTRGALVNWLVPRVSSLTTSEFILGAALGSIVNGVRCEDVQRLTFEDASFDLCTSTEVFEHVQDDYAGFAEVRRVLRPGGLMVFTVPIGSAIQTIERARVVDGQLIHDLPLEYHGDPYSQNDQILAMRNYGADIIDRLLASGFATAWLTMPVDTMMGYARPVVVARR